MSPTATNQGIEIPADSPQRTAPGSSLDNAARDYLHGRISLNEYTRQFEAYLHEAERVERSSGSSQNTSAFIKSLAQWLKHPLSGQHVKVSTIFF